MLHGNMPISKLYHPQVLITNKLGAGIRTIIVAYDLL